MMKTFIAKSEDAIQPVGAIKAIRSKAASHKLFTYALELVILYVLVFAAMSTFAHEPAKATKPTGKLEFDICH